MAIICCSRTHLFICEIVICSVSMQARDCGWCSDKRDKKSPSSEVTSGDRRRESDQKSVENMSTNWDRALKERRKELFECHGSTALVRALDKASLWKKCCEQMHEVEGSDDSHARLSEEHQGGHHARFGSISQVSSAWW